MKNGDDTYAAIVEDPPIDQMVLVATAIAIDTKFGGDFAPRELLRCDRSKSGLKTAKISLCLLFAPSLEGVVEYLINPRLCFRE